ncbi:MAG: thioredoxin family protein [Planctomyces sp.]|nr:thioredoxin family protein [Planctomyces sp.]
MTSRIACALLVLASVAAEGIAGGRNFVCDDPSLAAAAEAERVRSARFWSGRDLPGDWHRPCPIAVNAGEAASGAGRTRFTIRDGEVYGWRMDVAGSRETLLRDVVPHEVDHMVRASLVRRPIPRWLDEGCASLFESSASHERLRRTLATDVELRLTPAFLNGQQYPAAPGDVQRVYTAGFSLVEFLLERGGPETLLKLQLGAAPVTTRIEALYGLTVPDLDRAWGTWRTDRAMRGAACRDVGCRMHWPSRPELPALRVFTAGWCAACRRFRMDLDQHPEFRAQLQRRFRIEFLDVDTAAGHRVAAAESVRTLPTFLCPDVRIEGYRNAAWLLEQLGLSGDTPQERPVGAPRSAPESDDISDDHDREETTSDAEPIASQEAPAGAAATAIATPAGTGRRDTGGRSWIDWAARGAPSLLSALKLAGIVGGSAATGGLGGAGALWLLLRWRRQRRARTHGTRGGAEEGRTLTVRAPFPRRLDEARELLELRESEGRVAALDALRGMFLDDEARKVVDGADASAASTVSRLMAEVDRRVSEVAPLSTGAV